jgi:hypothetical protein
MSTTLLFTNGGSLMCTVSMPVVAAAVTCALVHPSESVALAQTALTDVMYATDACDEPAPTQDACEEHVGGVESGESEECNRGI